MPRYGRGIVDAVDAEGITVVFPKARAASSWRHSCAAIDASRSRGQQKLPQALPEDACGARFRARPAALCVEANAPRTRLARVLLPAPVGNVAGLRAPLLPTFRTESNDEISDPANAPATTAHCHAETATRGAPAAAFLARLRPGSARRDGAQPVPRGRGLAARRGPRRDRRRRRRRRAARHRSRGDGADRRRALRARELAAVVVERAPAEQRQRHRRARHDRRRRRPAPAPARPDQRAAARAARPRARLRDHRVARRRRLPAHRARRARRDERHVAAGRGRSRCRSR